jgi:hypothetical protein
MSTRNVDVSGYTFAENEHLFSHYHLQVEATFLRAVHENIKEDHVILEVNSLRYVIFICIYTSKCFNSLCCLRNCASTMVFHYI